MQLLLMVIVATAASLRSTGVAAAAATDDEKINIDIPTVLKSAIPRAIAAGASRIDVAKTTAATAP